MWSVEDDDAIGDLAEVVGAPVGEGDSLVDAEQPFPFWILVPGWLILDDDDEVVDAIVDPPGKLGEAVVDGVGEGAAVHGHPSSLGGCIATLRRPGA